mmetsp:Transcript_46077/g.103635  ORF Transcript_46077/g.103635 Transcript_46077/m.103635 type:complete len:147 (-) Transcript_46077:73-513(-)
MAVIQDYRAGVSAWFIFFLTLMLLNAPTVGIWTLIALFALLLAVFNILASLKEGDCGWSFLGGLKKVVASRCPFVLTRHMGFLYNLAFLPLCALGVSFSPYASSFIGIALAFVIGEVVDILFFVLCCSACRGGGSAGEKGEEKKKQ